MAPLLALERAGLPVLRTWRLTASQWDVHLAIRTQWARNKHSADCTHFCEPSGVMEAWADATILLLQRLLPTLVGPWTLPHSKRE